MHAPIPTHYAIESLASKFFQNGGKKFRPMLKTHKLHYELKMF